MMRAPGRKYRSDLCRVLHALFAGVVFAIGLLAPRDAFAGCPGGQAVSPDTDGHCCWSGQVWTKGHCVGVPTSCPPELSVNASTQTCALAACPDGQVRTEDKVHCCWPEQGWSKTRNVCVGVPRCPAGTEVEDERCVPPESTARAQAEAAATAAAAAAAAAEAARQQQAAAEALRQQHAAEEAEKQRVAEAEAKAAAERAERQRAADEAAEQAHEAWDAKRKARRSRRTAGIVLGSIGVAGGAVAVTFAVLGNAQNTSITNGAFARGADIANAASTGQTYNTVSIASAIAGGVFLGVALPLILADLPPSEPPPAPRVSWTIVPTGRGAALEGRF